MKRILTYILAVATFAAVHAAESPVNVQKLGSDSTLTGSIVVGAGKSITATGNGSITATNIAGNATIGGNATLTPLTVNATTSAITGPGNAMQFASANGLLSSDIHYIAAPYGAPAAYSTLKTNVDSVIAANRSTFNDGTNGWIAAVGTYGNIYISDFYLAATVYPEYFTPTQIRNITTKFIAAASNGSVPKPAGGGFVPAGSLPISINPATAAAVNYYSGLDNVYSHVTGDPIWAIPLLLKQYYDATGDTTGFTSDLAVLKTALLAVPRNGTTHLVSAGTTAGTLWISWGFHDDVQKSGDDLLGSVFYWRAATAMAALYTANGDSTNASTMTADAALIAANIDTLWNSGAGMYNAATVQCAQIDINGSAMAASVGLISASRIASIASYLDTNSSTLFQSSGYVRQSPINWSNYWVASPPHYDDYYWSWGNYYVLDALRRSSPTKAVSQATALANSASNLIEYYNVTTAGGAANNLESPMGAFRFINVYASLFPATAPSPIHYLSFSLQGDTTVEGALLLPNAGLVLGENLGGLSDPGAGNALIRGNATIGALISSLITYPGNITISATGTAKNLSLTATGNITFNPTGFVSIGTGTPTQLLHVEKSIDSNVIAQVVNSNAGSSANARLLVSNGTNTGGIQINGTGQSGPGEVQLYSGGAFDLILKRNGTERLRMTSAGLTMSGILLIGSSPTTINDSAGKILSTALNTVQPAQGGTGLTALGTGIATWLGTPTSTNFAAALTGGTGTGAVAFSISPTFVTPILGNATATKIDIGTVTGSQALHVENNTNGNVIAEVYNQNAGSSTNARIVVSNGTNFGGLQMNGTGAAEPGNLRVYNTSDIFFVRNGTERLRLDTNGAVFSGLMTSSNNTDATTGGAGSIITAGGIYAAKKIIAGTDIQALGNATVGGTLNVTGAVSFTIPLAVNSGGTGAATLTGLIKGNGTSAMTAAVAGTDYIAPGSAGSFTTVTASSYVKLPSYIVSGLPAAATAGAGAMAYVTDSTATAITGLGLAVIGSGSNKVVVVSDGTNWIVQ